MESNEQDKLTNEIDKLIHKIDSDRKQTDRHLRVLVGLSEKDKGVKQRKRKKESWTHNSMMTARVKGDEGGRR